MFRVSKLPKILGYSLDRLSAERRHSVIKYLTNGAVKKVGEIESAEIKTRGDEDPVHQSHYNKADKEEIISVLIIPVDKTRGIFIHHVYIDGRGTMRLGDKREYHTLRVVQNMDSEKAKDSQAHESLTQES
ncbi:hypothetical protein E4U19_001809 [Claviceps sp. Clav32 group G5]|nr:hypothetical protein E4U19_001809 [Claviceps sp. Clav32 group G5]KAG6042520.1 hypothetical protein E4U39_005775 [Claviceps sp. Clav50 group G5]